MIERIVVAILTNVGSWLITKGLQYIQSQTEKATHDANVDHRLNELKTAYKEAADGKPVTPEQRKKLNQAIRNFIRGDGNHSGL